MQAVDTLHTLEFLLDGSLEYKQPFSKKSFLGHLTASVESDNGEKGLFLLMSGIMCPPSLRADLAEASVTH